MNANSSLNSFEEWREPESDSSEQLVSVHPVVRLRYKEEEAKASSAETKQLSSREQNLALGSEPPQPDKQICLRAESNGPASNVSGKCQRLLPEDKDFAESEDFDTQEVDENKITSEIWMQKGWLYNKQLGYCPNNLQQIQFLALGPNDMPHDAAPSHSQELATRPQAKAARASTQTLAQSRKAIELKKMNMLRTKNILDYFLVSMERFRNGIESRNHSLIEKFSYISITQKLHLELQSLLAAAS